MGFGTLAKWIKIVREWTDAYDKRGLTLSQRLKYLDNMDQFLLSLLPVPITISTATAQHVQGISHELFEETLVLNAAFRGVLNSLDTDTQIEFNSRMLSTDPAECFFSILKRMCPRPTIRLVLQAWRTTSREHKKQLDENRG